MHTFADKHTLIPEIKQRFLKSIHPVGVTVRTHTVDNCVSKAGKLVSNPADGTSESDSSIWRCHLRLVQPAVSDHWGGFI